MPADVLFTGGAVFTGTGEPLHGHAVVVTGDRITAVVHPMKDGAKGGSLFYIVLPDGNRLYTDIARPKGGS